MSIRRAVCRVLGHARRLEQTGRLRNGQKAIAATCSRCGVIVEFRPVTRQYRRRLKFGRA